MKSGTNELSKLLHNAEEFAVKIELKLPHISDCIYSLIKLIRAYDKNQRKLVDYLVKAERYHKIQNELIELISTWLTPQQIKYAQKYIKKLEKEILRDEDRNTKIS